MNQVVEGVISIVSGLKKREKEALLENLMMDKDLSEDFYDIFLLRQRRKETARHFEDFEKELKTKGKIK